MATFGFEVFKVIYAPMRQKLNFLEGLRPVTSGLKPSIYHPPILQCGGGSVVVYSSFAASGPGQFAVSYEQLILLSKNKIKKILKVNVQPSVALKLKHTWVYGAEQ